MVNPIEVIRDLQWLSRTHPDLREICDRAITALIIQDDKLRKYEADK